jgi:hypothetical protein
MAHEKKAAIKRKRKFRNVTNSALAASVATAKVSLRAKKGGDAKRSRNIRAKFRRTAIKEMGTVKGNAFADKVAKDARGLAARVKQSRPHSIGKVPKKHKRPKLGDELVKKAPNRTATMDDARRTLNTRHRSKVAIGRAKKGARTRAALKLGGRIARGAAKGIFRGGFVGAIAGALIGGLAGVREAQGKGPTKTKIRNKRKPDFI